VKSRMETDTFVRIKQQIARRQTIRTQINRRSPRQALFIIILKINVSRVNLRCTVSLLEHIQGGIAHIFPGNADRVLSIILSGPRRVQRATKSIIYLSFSKVHPPKENNKQE